MVSRSSSRLRTGSWPRAPQGRTRALAPVPAAKREQRVKVPVPGGLCVGVEQGVQVPDVPVDRPDPQPGGNDLGRHGGDGIGVEVVGNVVAHSGEGAQIDFLEAEARDGAQGVRAGPGGGS